MVAQKPLHRVTFPGFYVCNELRATERRTGATNFGTARLRTEYGSLSSARVKIPFTTAYRDIRRRREKYVSENTSDFVRSGCRALCFRSPASACRRQFKKSQPHHRHRAGKPLL